MFKTILICILLLSLSGCGINHMPLSIQDRKNIKSIYVDPNISRPEKMYVFASGAQIGMAFGILGAVGSSIINHDVASTTQQFAEKNHIDIRKIIYNKWQQKINNKMLFKTSTQPSDSILTTRINLYGISIPHGFSSDYVPVLNIKATLTRNNKIIWKDNEQILPTIFSTTPRYKMAEILRDPNKLYLMWDKAAEKIIDTMIADLNK